MKHIESIGNFAKKLKQGVVEKKINQFRLSGYRFIYQQPKHHCKSSIAGKCQVGKAKLITAVDKKESEI